MACATPADAPDDTALHVIDNGFTRWTHTNFDTSDSAFTFAVVSDLYGDGHEGVFGHRWDVILQFSRRLVGRKNAEDSHAFDQISLIHIGEKDSC